MRLALPVVLALMLATPPAQPKPAGTAAPVLPWIQDDYPRAVALAKARRLPIFVEAWAPW